MSPVVLRWSAVVCFVVAFVLLFVAAERYQAYVDARAWEGALLRNEPDIPSNQFARSVAVAALNTAPKYPPVVIYYGISGVLVAAAGVACLLLIGIGKLRSAFRSREKLTVNAG